MDYNLGLENFDTGGSGDVEVVSIPGIRFNYWVVLLIAIFVLGLAYWLSGPDEKNNS